MDFLPGGQYASLADSDVAKTVTCDNTNCRSEGLLGRMRVDRRKAPNAKAQTLVAKEQVRSNGADFSGLDKDQLRAVRKIARQELKDSSKEKVALEMAAVQREDDEEAQRDHNRRKAFRDAREAARSSIPLVRCVGTLRSLDNQQLIKQLQARKVPGYTKLSSKQARLDRLLEVVGAELSEEKTGMDASGSGDSGGMPFTAAGPEQGDSLFELWLDAHGESTWEAVDQTRQLRDSEEWLQWIQWDSE